MNPAVAHPLGDRSPGAVIIPAALGVPMRRAILVVALLAFPLSLGVLVQTAEVAEAHAGSYSAVKVTASSLTVRSGPGSGYPSVGSASSGDKFVKIDAQNGWQKIYFKGGTGWVNAAYTTGVSSGLVTKIMATDVNVRSGPGTGYSVVGSVDSPQAYIVLDSGDARSGGYNGVEYIWHKIQYADGVGWVYDQYTNEGSVGGMIEPNFAESELHSTYSACARFHISKDLTSRLQSLRDQVGAITLSNGYRCPEHNAAVGGSSTSYHLSGQGADITYCGGLSYSTCATYARNVGLDALNEGDHLHVSVPAGGGV